MRSTWDLVNKEYYHDPNMKIVVILGDGNGKDLFNALNLNDINNVVFKRVSHARGVSLSQPIGSHKSIKTKRDVAECREK
jgi:hypothetical protein